MTGSDSPEHPEGSAQLWDEAATWNLAAPDANLQAAIERLPDRGRGEVEQVLFPDGAVVEPVECPAGVGHLEHDVAARPDQRPKRTERLADVVVPGDKPGGKRLMPVDGGVVPELASREHLRNIVPVVREATSICALTEGVPSGAIVMVPLKVSN